MYVRQRRRASLTEAKHPLVGTAKVVAPAEMYQGERMKASLPLTSLQRLISLTDHQGATGSGRRQLRCARGAGLRQGARREAEGRRCDMMEHVHSRSVTVDMHCHHCGSLLWLRPI
jgi:hypothetical protein